MDGVMGFSYDWGQCGWGVLKRVPGWCWGGVFLKEADDGSRNCWIAKCWKDAAV